MNLFHYIFLFFKMHLFTPFSNHHLSTTAFCLCLKQQFLLRKYYTVLGQLRSLLISGLKQQSEHMIACSYCFNYRQKIIIYSPIYSLPSLKYNGHGLSFPPIFDSLEYLQILIPTRSCGDYVLIVGIFKGVNWYVSHHCSSQSLKGFTLQWFGEEVRNHNFCWTVFNGYSF